MTRGFHLFPSIRITSLISLMRIILLILFTVLLFQSTLLNSSRVTLANGKRLTKSINRIKVIKIQGNIEREEAGSEETVPILPNINDEIDKSSKSAILIKRQKRLQKAKSFVKLTSVLCLLVFLFHNMALARLYSCIESQASYKISLSLEHSLDMNKAITVKEDVYGCLSSFGWLPLMISVGVVCVYCSFFYKVLFLQ